MRKKVANIKKCVRVMCHGKPRSLWYGIKHAYWYARKALKFLSK